MTCWSNIELGGGKRRRCAQAAAVLLGALLTPVVSCASAQGSWPKIATPEGVTSFKMGEQINANGLPLRMRGIVSSKSPTQVAALFRASLGQPLVENRLASKLVLGRSQGEFYITVQLEPAGTGTRGVVAVSNLAAAISGRDASAKDKQHFLSGLPAGSKLVSHTGSVDGANSAAHDVFTNAHSPEFNAAHLKHMLAAEGYAFERQLPSVPNAGGNEAGVAEKGATLLFKRPEGESIAVIYRNGTGNTTIVLNTITYASSIQ